MIDVLAVAGCQLVEACILLVVDEPYNFGTQELVAVPPIALVHYHNLDAFAAPVVACRDDLAAVAVNAVELALLVIRRYFHHQLHSRHCR